jgi:methylase of polypeptide subunit release factors
VTTLADQPVAPAPTPSPLRLEPAAAFETVRSFLRDASFTEEETCSRLDIDSLERFRAVRDGRPDIPPRDALDMLVRLFLDNEAVTVSDVGRLFPEPALGAMRSLGLVREHRTDPGLVVANVLLYPTESLYIASDVAGLPDADDVQWWDLVYAAITSNTRTFVSKMPRARCHDFLDLCAGTGVAALVAASTFADNAWAVDVADRSTQFARFNARLNAVRNVTALSGDLFAPVEGLTFDCIVAHPPYVPSRKPTLAYRDGGADGEDVTRRIIAGLPTYLRPGGVFHCTATATERTDAPLEQRLRAMLGDAANEFDIAVVVINEFNPTEYYVRLAIAGRNTWPEAEEWHRHFAAIGVQRLVYSTIAIVRHQRAHEPFTVRRRAGSATGAREIGRLVRAAEESASVEALNRLLDSRPIIAGHVSLQSTHIREDGGWAMRSCLVSTEVPFDVRLPCPPAMVPLLGAMDGTRTLRQVYADMSAAGALADDASIERLAGYVHLLVAHGLVELDGEPGSDQLFVVA